MKGFFSTLLGALGGGPSAEDLTAMAAEPNVLYLDVRSPAEFASGHIPGAINVPLQQLHKAAKVIGASSRPVIAYCRSGARSGSAASTLQGQGFERVINGGGAVTLARALGMDLT
jgi:phage shock protein E